MSSILVIFRPNLCAMNSILLAIVVLPLKGLERTNCVEVGAWELGVGSKSPCIICGVN